MTSTTMQNKIMALTDAVCQEYRLEKQSFDEIAHYLSGIGETELSIFFDGLVALWDKLEKDELLGHIPTTNCRNIS